MLLIFGRKPMWDSIIFGIHIAVQIRGSWHAVMAIDIDQGKEGYIYSAFFILDLVAFLSLIPVPWPKITPWIWLQSISERHSSHFIPKMIP